MRGDPVRISFPYPPPGCCLSSFCSFHFYFPGFGFGHIFVLDFGDISLYTGAVD